MKYYMIKECFYSLQGEGIRAGEPSAFLRFAGCNLQCRQETHGFDCDTDFLGGRSLTAPEILEKLHAVSAGKCEWIVLTGGEPTLQLDAELIEKARAAGFKLAIETNGMRPLPGPIDWVCVSPKVPTDELALRYADELKYVIANRMPIPTATIEAKHYLLSPAFECGSSAINTQTLDWCIQLCLNNPKWRLSVQQHKGWRLR